MALYYFDVDDNGTVYPDDEGTDCDIFDQVKEEVIRALVEMIRDDGGGVVLQVSLNFEVEAEHRSHGISSPDSHV